MEKASRRTSFSPLPPWIFFTLGSHKKAVVPGSSISLIKKEEPSTYDETGSLSSLESGEKFETDDKTGSSKGITSMEKMLHSLLMGQEGVAAKQDKFNQAMGGCPRIWGSCLGVRKRWLRVRSL